MSPTAFTMPNSKRRARAISQAHPQAIIRLGWEMNLVDMAWFANGHEADYIRAFRRVVGNFQAPLGGVQVRLVSGLGPAGQSPRVRDLSGDDVVNYIGLDVYDFKHEGLVEERWSTST